MNSKCQNLVENYKKLLILKDGFGVGLKKEKLWSRDVLITKNIVLEIKNTLKSIKELMVVNYEKLEELVFVDLYSKKIKENLGIKSEQYLIKSTSITRSNGRLVASLRVIEPGESGKIEQEDPNNPTLKNNHNIFICYFNEKTLEMEDFIDFKKSVHAPNMPSINESIEKIEIRKSKNDDNFIVSLDDALFFIDENTNGVKRFSINNSKNDSYVDFGEYIYIIDKNSKDIKRVNKKTRDEMIIKNVCEYSSNNIIANNEELFIFRNITDASSDGIRQAEINIYNPEKNNRPETKTIYFDMLLGSDGPVMNHPYPGNKQAEESLDGKYIFVCGDDGFGVIDKSNYSMNTIINNNDEYDRIHKFVQSPDGRYVILLCVDGNTQVGVVNIFDVKSMGIKEGYIPYSDFAEMGSYIRDVELLDNGNITYSTGSMIGILGNNEDD